MGFLGSAREAQPEEPPSPEPPSIQAVGDEPLPQLRPREVRLEPAVPGDTIAPERHIPAPSPSTIVGTPSRQAAEMLAALRLEHEAEVARFQGKLRDLRQAHATEIARVRAEHAADMRRLVEALWDAQAVARAASLRAQGTVEMATPEPPTRSLLVRPRTWVVRAILSPGARIWAERVARCWPVTFQARR